MILGYVCELCKGCADSVTMLELKNGDVMLELGYICKDCEEQAIKNATDKWLWAGWTVSYNFQKCKKVDLMAFYEEKTKPLQHKPF